jgi:hypothetical protein
VIFVAPSSDPVDLDEFARAVDEATGDLSVAQTGRRFDLTAGGPLSEEQRAVFRAIAYTRQWHVESNDPSDVAAIAVYTSAPLRGLFRAAKSGLVAGVALAGVEVISVVRQGLRIRSYVLRREDVSVSAFGEAAPRAGAVPLVEVQYRYKFGPAGLLAGEGRVLYPTNADDQYVVPPDAAHVDAWDYLGQASIDEGINRRRSAASRSGYLLGVGARMLGGFEDPGVPIRTLLGLLAQPHGYDLAVAYREYDDPTLRTEIAAVQGIAWLDGALGSTPPRPPSVSSMS